MGAPRPLDFSIAGEFRHRYCAHVEVFWRAAIHTLRRFEPTPNKSTPQLKYLYTYIYICIYVYIYTLYIYMHAYIHTYI